MHRTFQKFIECLSNAEDAAGFSEAMTIAAAALDLSCFAYLALPRSPKGEPCLISTYPKQWTSHYLRCKYQRIDPVIVRALQDPSPFPWGIGIPAKYNSLVQQQLFDEASQFGIRFGFTVPIHDGRGPIAALTFATNSREAQFERSVSSHPRVLQLMALYFHAHVRRKFDNQHVVGGVTLSPREFECLEWASKGKTAWEIGHILGISRNTVAHYLSSAKEKLGVRTIVQAVMHLAAARGGKQN